jgi:hypothetical protein
MPRRRALAVSWQQFGSSGSRSSEAGSVLPVQTAWVGTVSTQSLHTVLQVGCSAEHLSVMVRLAPHCCQPRLISIKSCGGRLPSVACGHARSCTAAAAATYATHALRFALKAMSVCKGKEKEKLSNLQTPEAILGSHTRGLTTAPYGCMCMLQVEPEHGLRQA